MLTALRDFRIKKDNMPTLEKKEEKILRTIKKIVVGLLVCCFICGASGCKEKEATIDLPQNISLTTQEDTEPVIKMYDINSKTIKEMKLEEYLKGVVAGEMFNTWSLEALKAQAILARTFTLSFLQNSTSKYEGANISNDINEAQAYDETKINENIERAVNETRGKIIVSDGELIEAWFHSNSGGKTTKASTGLGFLGEENHTKTADSFETAETSENYNWKATFTKSEILSKLREMGVSVATISNLEVGERDESGRAINFKIGEVTFSANTFRLKMGSTKFKSTLIDEIVVSLNSISFVGRGYGHGVGMSQWGAKIMAEEGKTADEIINHYFDNIDIVYAKYETKD